MLVTATQAPPVWRVPEGQAAVPVGGGGAWPGFETTLPATHSDTSAAGVEGAGGPGCGARGRRRGLAELRHDAPNQQPGPTGLEGAGGTGGPGRGAGGRRRGQD